MCRIPFGICSLHPKHKCCLCIAATRSVRLMPALDFIELIIQVPLLIVSFTVQDTWASHYTLMLSVNIVATMVKLVGSIASFCAGIPGRDSGLISTWQYKCYAWVRATALALFAWGWLLNWVLTTWAIGDSAYYDDETWGLCSFCL